MTELFLDGFRAVPSQAASFKLTAENIFFTKTSSYTYDVELPLAIAENRRIFGNIDRIDVTKEARSLAARLVVDNVTVLVGEARITSVTDKAVKVQLLGEASAYNYGNKMADTYLDELDLGDWYWETWPDGSAMGNPAFGYRNRPPEWYTLDSPVKHAGYVLARAGYKGPDFGDDTYSDEELLDLLHSGALGWVAYPTYSSASDIRFNAIAWQERTQGARNYFPFLRDYEGESGRLRPSDGRKPESAFAIQPFIWKVAEIVARRTGFTLDNDDNALYSDPFLRTIFIVNTSPSAEIAKCLPHWSVNDFWTQLENTFGLVMSIDYANKTMKLRRRRDYYAAANVLPLPLIVDEFDTTLKDETQTDISASNVGFADFDNGPEDLLSDSITANAQTMEFESPEALIQWCGQQPTLHTYKNVVFHCADGRRFIYSTDVHGEPGIIEVDMFRPRIVKADKTEIEVQLKIVPARYAVHNADIFAAWYEAVGSGPHHRDIPDGTFPVTMLQVPGSDAPALSPEADRIDIQAIIEGDEEAEEETAESIAPDRLYIAIHDLRVFDEYHPTVTLKSGGEISQMFEYPRALLRERCYANIDGSVRFDDSPRSLSLIPIAGQTNLAAATVTGQVKIDTTVRHCFRFISDTIPDPGAIFLIRNRRFVCEKLEATIHPDGLDKMITGYFYEFLP